MLYFVTIRKGMITRMGTCVPYKWILGLGRASPGRESILYISNFFYLCYRRVYSRKELIWISRQNYFHHFGKNQQSHSDISPQIWLAILKKL